MKNPVFKFKQFEIVHGKSKMKVGTDGVLLGAWTGVNRMKTILDVGSGCGLIALMLAQRNKEAKIDAVEPHEGSISDLTVNFKNSPWSDRLAGYHSELQSFNPEKQYELIVSNPPFFNAGTNSPDLSRHSARHTSTLSHYDLLRNVDRLLKSNGMASFILPVEESITFIHESHKMGFYVSRKALFKSMSSKKVERILFSLSKEKPAYTELEELTQYKETGVWSDEYKALTKNFYLKI